MLTIRMDDINQPIVIQLWRCSLTSYYPYIYLYQFLDPSSLFYFLFITITMDMQTRWWMVVRCETVGRVGANSVGPHKWCYCNSHSPAGRPPCQYLSQCLNVRSGSLRDRQLQRETTWRPRLPLLKINEECLGFCLRKDFNKFSASLKNRINKFVMFDICSICSWAWFFVLSDCRTVAHWPDMERGSLPEQVS